MKKIPKQRLPKIGEIIRVYFSSPQGRARAKVISISSYTGRFTKLYTHIIRLTSNNNKGWSEMAWNKDNWIYMWHLDGYYKE